MHKNKKLIFFNLLKYFFYLIKKNRIKWLILILKNSQPLTSWLTDMAPIIYKLHPFTKYK